MLVLRIRFKINRFPFYLYSQRLKKIRSQTFDLSRARRNDFLEGERGKGEKAD
jgi:hypothetical protein